MSMQHDLIALDADGVLIDYHEGYAQAWERAFGFRPTVRNAEGYHPRDYWDVPTLTASELKHFRVHGLSEQTWRNMPAMPGALEACQQLSQAGFRLMCVTALSPAYGAARAHNLKRLGFELADVLAVGTSGLGNPKAKALLDLQPVAFVDDYLGYLQGLPPGTWRALIEGRTLNNPNIDGQLEPPSSRHACLLDFAHYWLTQHPSAAAPTNCDRGRL
jgi:hypothetical protein